ncbi:MAG: hypothetical protein WA719_07180, partial [Thermoplasmata archaeon]
MAKIGGTKGWLVLTSVAVLMALAVVPAVAGAAGASPAPISAADSPSNQWAYGGVGWSNGSTAFGNDLVTWNASFGWTVIFTATNTTANTVQIEEQRTVGISLTETFAGPTTQASYSYQAHESDVAFANLTNHSTVYENGVPVAALGIDNDSTQIAGAIAESISVTTSGVTKTASFDVTGTAHTSAQFTPSLGLIPMNLSGATMWNSSSTINPSGSWNITWAWANNGFLGQNGSGTRYSNGTVDTSGTVNLTGYDVTTHYPVPVFGDHQQRQAVVLLIQGPLGNYDAFVFSPDGFNLFGTEAHAYDSQSLGSATISAETLYVSSGPGGPEVSAASTTFGANAQAVSTLGTPVNGNAPAASPSPGTTVTGSPMSVNQAQAESNCLANGCSATASAVSGFGGLVIVATLAAVAVVGTLVVVEWRSYARRRSRTGLIGGYS